MAFTVPAPQKDPSTESAIRMILGFVSNRQKMRQDQKQHEDEMAHRTAVEERMQAHTAVQTHALVQKTDAQVSLFDAQEEEVRRKTAYAQSTEGKTAEFLKQRNELQKDVTNAWKEMLALNAPNMTLESMKEGQSHLLASSLYGSGVGGVGMSSYQELLPYTRNTLKGQYDTQRATEQRLAQQYINQYEQLDKGDKTRQNLSKVMGSLQKIVSGSDITQGEKERAFTSAQFGLDPEQKINLPGWGNKIPAERLTDEQLTNFLQGTSSFSDQGRIASAEARGRGLAGFVPTRATRDPNQPRDPVFEQIGEDLSGVTGTLDRMNLSDSGRTQLVRTREEYDNLPVGTSYRDVNGNIGTKR